VSATLLHYLVLLAYAVAIFSVVYAVYSIPLIARPNRGAIGQRRTEALEENSGFALIEPLMRRAASVVADVRKGDVLRLGDALDRLAVRQRQLLVEAGNYLGITEDEYLGLFFICGIGGVLTALVFSLLLELGWGLVVIAGLGAMATLHSQVTGAAAHRKKMMTRGLPAALDVAAMCMGAGLDFPGALRQISLGAPAGDVVGEEFGRMLRGLELGQTRRQALLEMEERVPAESVRDFCRALIQAEEKGNPIAEALRIQAQMSRMRRSIAAEEAAARAGVLMIIPMVLLMGCILILLMGPFMAGGGGFD
jgi:tight adherence protein C